VPDEPLTYSSAGVDIAAADQAVRGVGAAIAATHDERVLGGIGGFGGMFAAQFPGVERPVLVSSIDGVGTKTKVAAMVGDYSGIGADIVNHCVNDVLCQGARPLFFLDYFGCSRLDPVAFDAVVRGAADACGKVGCALIGGETAEMPGVYHDGEVDVVGAIVGVVDADKRLPRPRARPGDRLVGLASDGLHTNGYSLARRALFELGGRSVHDESPGGGESFGQALLRPHRCYFQSVWPLIDEDRGVYAAAHITGGGIAGNLVRAIPANTQAVVFRSSWEPPALFRAIQSAGRVPDDEMFRAFNMGIGMVLVVGHDHVADVVRRLNEAGEHAAEIGELRSGGQDVQLA
jgi:phosphoribosylformylglycinamidine cyclo-ligase